MNQNDANRESAPVYPPDVDTIERTILNSMSEGVITVECDGTINTVNPSALRILGLEESELVGQPLDKVFDSANNPLREVFDRVVQNGVHALHEEITYNRSDGQQIDLAVATSLLDFDACTPGLQSVVIVFRDVTAFKSIERARRKAADHLSHELRTPLSIIKASVVMLQRLSQPSAKFNKVADRIHRNLDRLIGIQAIVEEILNPPPYRPEDCDLSQRIEQALDRTTREAAHRTVRLVRDLEEIRTDTVDCHVLDTVVQTLAKNAIEATPDEGEVLVSLRRIEEDVLLEVRDHGVGIPAGEEEFVFDGFHHIQETDEYSSKRPYEFGAGGKGLELLKLRVLSEIYPVDISVQSRRCIHMPKPSDQCPGRISACTGAKDLDGCKDASETVFSVTFHEQPRTQD